eukprot:6173151-Pleurochrysis_carterae.AAC.9
MFIVASLHYRSVRLSIFAWTKTCKWGHPIATLPSDEGDYTSLVAGHKFCKSARTFSGKACGSHRSIQNTSTSTS